MELHRTSRTRLAWTGRSLGLALLTGLAAVFGCSGPPSTSVEQLRRADLDIRNLPEVYVSIRHGQREIAAVNGFTHSATSTDGAVEVSVDVWIHADFPAAWADDISVWYLGPDGWKRVKDKVSFNAVHIGVFDGEGTAGEFRRLWVDNRGGGPFELSVGQWRHPIAGNAKVSCGFPKPETPAAAVVRVGGRDVGLIWDTETGGVPRAIVLDVTGERRYSWRIVRYSPTGVSSIPVPSGFVSHRHLHFFEKADGVIFLEAAPKSVAVRQGEASPVYVEVTDP